MKAAETTEEFDDVLPQTNSTTVEKKSGFESTFMLIIFKIVFYIPALALALLAVPVFFTRTWFSKKGG